MLPLLIAAGSAVAFLVAYHTYGRWLGARIFRLSADAVCPSVRLNDGDDYVPTPKSVVFGHHFTSIAGTGPIVGPAIAVMWGWLPALLWVVLGSIFIGAVHDLGSLVVSLRNDGKTVGEIAGRVMNARVRVLFLCVLFLAITIVLAVFGLVIANVFDLYPQSIFPCLVQIPLAVGIGVWLHRRGVSLVVPSVLALGLMYLSVIYGDWGPLHAVNTYLGGQQGVTGDGLSIYGWTLLLLFYSYIASVLPVWALLQPRDFINSLQLLSALGLIVVGLVFASVWGGAPPVEGAARPPLEMVAPVVNWHPPGAPAMVPFLFITIACGAISGFHCLVSSGTSSKQLRTEPEARFVGYGAMVTEGFLAVLVILACTAGIGLGLSGDVTKGARVTWFYTEVGKESMTAVRAGDLVSSVEISQSGLFDAVVIGRTAFEARYHGWADSSGLASTVGAFVTGASNFVGAVGVPRAVAVALMGVLVASFAGTTLDTACRLQRYVVQELVATLRGTSADRAAGAVDRPVTADPLSWLANKHGATLFAVATAGLLAAIPTPGQPWSLANAGKGGMILWPLFGATNQLLGGLAFLVVLFYLRRRAWATWFLIFPMALMLVMPAWAMVSELPGWIESKRFVLAGIAVATLLLEAWMIVEAALMFPRVRGVLERAPGDADPSADRGFEVLAVPAVDPGQ